MDGRLLAQGLARQLESRWPLLAMLLILVLGLIALNWTPREEEPQIVVPLVEVQVQAPGLSSRQVERQVVQPLEGLLAQLPNIEHIYSTSQSGQAVVSVRFLVGSDPDQALFDAYTKLYSHTDLIPPAVSHWLVKPVAIDDVPILIFGLWSPDDRLDPYGLRRLAEEAAHRLQALPDIQQVQVVGGYPRQIRLELDPGQLAARQVDLAQLLQALQLSNQLRELGTVTLDNRAITLEAGLELTVEQLAGLVVAVVDGRPVHLGELVTVRDGPAPPSQYSWLRRGPAHPLGSAHEARPMVALAVAKQRGSNAVWVADAVHQELEQMRQQWLPSALQVELLRDYGATADAKVDNLINSLLLAVITVVGFIAVFLGWRAALVVALAVPICYAIALGVNWAVGYSINRVTLFALILALGLLVDDPITGVDNIERHLRRGGDRLSAVVTAMVELRWPLIISTLTLIFAFGPLAFITGMMGPYMAPMALNVPVAVVASTLVAFLFTPWLSARLLKPVAGLSPTLDLQAPYPRLLGWLLAEPRRCRRLLGVVIALFVLSLLLPLWRLVPLKLLPYDNQNELGVLVEMPEGSSLEQTDALLNEVASIVARQPEVVALAGYSGVAAPVDFNGLVRRYYLRQSAELGELRLTLIDKSLREAQSHAILLRLRQPLASLAERHGARIKLLEVPPGPPVLSTLVAELRASQPQAEAQLARAAQQLQTRLAREPGVVDIDSTLIEPHARWRFVPDQAKAASSGVAVADISQLLQLATTGIDAGFLRQERELHPLPLRLVLPETLRHDRLWLDQLPLRGRVALQQQQAGGVVAAPYPLVPLKELGQWQEIPAEEPLHRKNLQRVVYVTADLAGRTPAEVIADLHADRGLQGEQWRPLAERTYLSPGGGIGWQLPDGVELEWAGEGEWQITLRVFRDLGLAFAAALIGIAFTLRAQTGSWALAGVIMSSIPLSLVGLLPGFALLNASSPTVAGIADPVLFTATAMIGMLALAGIVVRNALILVEFITEARRQGSALLEAVQSAGAARLRPVLLTAVTTLLGNVVITLDPVFAGLAWAIIFGLLASTALTLLVVPAIYFLIYRHEGA